LNSLKTSCSSSSLLTTIGVTPSGISHIFKPYFFTNSSVCSLSVVLSSDDKFVSFLPSNAYVVSHIGNNTNAAANKIATFLLKYLYSLYFLLC